MGRAYPRHLSSDHDPLFEAHRWTANLRIVETDEIKTVPHVPLSHPFVERLIGTMRREFLDHVLFWNARDLDRKRAEFQVYYNAARSHASLEGRTPLTFAGNHPDPCGSAPRAVGRLLSGARPAPCRCLTANSRPTRAEKGDLGGRRVDAHGHLLHAPRRRRVHDLGTQHFTQHDKAQITKRLLSNL